MGTLFVGKMLNFYGIDIKMYGSYVVFYVFVLVSSYVLV